MERTIRVTGKGKISVKPDTIRLLITQQSVEPTYEGAVRESAVRKNELTDAFGTLGFKKEDLKTLYFNVDTEYESYQERDKSWRKRLVGYKYTHRMKIEFPADNEMLGRVLLKISRCPGEPEFSIEYTIADQEAAKNELLGKAVTDAKAKAEVLTKAAGVTLQDIQLIDYSWGEVEFVSHPMNKMLMASDCCLPDEDGIDIDIEADDIDITDTVTVVWGIV